MTAEQTIHIFSFGFKYYLDQPPVCDIRIDVRGKIRNPQDHLPPGVTGKDAIVQKTILKSSENQKYIQQLSNRVLKAMHKTDSDQFSVGVGCRSGIHRSVVVATSMAEQLRKKGYAVDVEHRDLKEAS
jgi:UPF0042 nucleotide-binding protein